MYVWERVQILETVLEVLCFATFCTVEHPKIYASTLHGGGLVMGKGLCILILSVWGSRSGPLSMYDYYTKAKENP